MSRIIIATQVGRRTATDQLTNCWVHFSPGSLEPRLATVRINRPDEHFIASFELQANRPEQQIEEMRLWALNRGGCNITTIGETSITYLRLKPGITGGNAYRRENYVDEVETVIAVSFDIVHPRSALSSC